MRLLLAIGALVCATAGAVSPGSATATSSCGRPGYSYAGLQAARAAHGVRADVVALGAPYVASGHVAAWVGVGGPGQGKGGTDAWIQVGLSAFQGEGSRLYLEVNRPGVGPRYTELRSRVAAGSRFRIAVREVRGKPSWWAVWVNRKRVSTPVYLPGSSGRWRPIVTAETWDGGRRVCNLFRYRFDRVSVIDGRRIWRRFERGYRFQDPGYRVLGSRRGFVARSVRPLPRSTPTAHAAAAPSVQDADGSPGPDVALEDENGAVGDADAAVGDGLPEELGSAGAVDPDDPAPGPLAEP
jgi:hypothetical protein